MGALRALIFWTHRPGTLRPDPRHPPYPSATTAQARPWHARSPATADAHGAPSRAHSPLTEA